MSTPRRFRPGAWDPLEERVVLSTFGLSGRLDRAALHQGWDPSPAASRVAHRPIPRARAAQQTPAAVIDQQYAAYAADVAAAVTLYFRSLQSGADQFQTIPLVLRETYVPGSGRFAVDRTDFPAPTPTSPAVVSTGSTTYQVTGSGPGFLTGVLPFNPTTGGYGGNLGVDLDSNGQPDPLPDAVIPAGTALEINIPFNQAVVGDVANQYLNYVSQRTLTLSRDLVSYFNRLPIRLPRVPGAYRTQRPETAIQLYLANQIAGQGPQLLLQQLATLPLPSSTGSAVDLYAATASSVIESSRQQVREGVRLLFAGRSVQGVGQLTPAIPVQP